MLGGGEQGQAAQVFQLAGAGHRHDSFCDGDGAQKAVDMRCKLLYLSRVSGAPGKFCEIEGVDRPARRKRDSDSLN